MLNVKLLGKHMFFLKIVFVAILGATIFSGCTTKIEVNKEVGQLNLKNEKLKQEKSIDNVIAIVSPKIAQNSAVKEAQSQANINPFYNYNRNRIVEFNVSSTFQKDYMTHLEQALENSISEIISAKGFKLKGPYSVFDDMTYQDKKAVYLAFVPKIDFNIDKKVLSSKREKLYSREEGVIQIGGSVIVSMIEPMTGQVFVNRRINLSDFKIEESYIFENQHSTGDGSLIGKLSDTVSAPKGLYDNTDVALTNAINKFYAKAIERINAYIEREEILSFENDILKLKGLKRF